MKERCKLCGGSEKSFSQIQYKHWVSIAIIIKLYKGIHRCMLTHIYILYYACIHYTGKMRSVQWLDSPDMWQFKPKECDRVI